MFTSEPTAEFGKYDLNLITWISSSFFASLLPCCSANFHNSLLILNTIYVNFSISGFFILSLVLK